MNPAGQSTGGWKGPAAMNDVERVRDAADIVRIVGEHVALKAKGREYIGLCPFHDDHSPSMHVVPGKQIFHCFVCAAGGDVFTFVEKYHRMDFREALEYLAERCNIKLTPRSAQGSLADAAETPAHSRSSLAQANAQAAAFFRAVLNHEQHGRAARAVVERRGISPEMVERFAIGASPDRWDGLIAKIDSMRWDRSLFAAAGLLKPRDDGSHYDAFRNRLIFPIRDQIGRVIAFGGRRIDDADEPKYLNSPETPLFNKSAALFGLHQAVQAIQRERTAIVTEGYTDVIACHQAGFENVVATLGTALTPGHATILRRLCDTVILLFDGDDAGQRAADRAVEVFFSESIDVRIATLNRFTDAKDPDELLKREGGDGAFRRALGASTDLLDYRFARMRERLAGAGLSALERATNDEIARLGELGFHKVSPIRRQLVLRRLHEVTSIGESVLAEQLRRARPRAGSRPEPEPTRGAGSEAPGVDDPRTLVEAIGCILTEATLWQGLSEEDRAILKPDAYRSPTMRAIAGAMEHVAELGRPPSLANVLSVLEDVEAKAAAVAIQTRTEITAEQRVAATLEQCLASERRARSRDVSTDHLDELEGLRAVVSRQQADQQFGYDPRKAFRSTPS